MSGTRVDAQSGPTLWPTRNTLALAVRSRSVAQLQHLLGHAVDLERPEAHQASNA